MKLCSWLLVANTQLIIIIKVDKWLSTCDLCPNILIIPFHWKICPENFVITRFDNHQSFYMRLTFFSENVVIKSILWWWKYFYKFFEGWQKISYVIIHSVFLLLVFKNLWIVEVCKTSNHWLFNYFDRWSINFVKVGI